ncbi:MAG: sulfurtransferase [Flavobacteriales bacterium]|nr:sulfurtransferase [Flavobacteriales bacterium]
MNWNNLGGVIAVVFCISCSNNQPKQVSYHNPGALIDTAELNESAQEKFTLIDFRKREEYLSGHIANAINITKKEVQDTSATVDGIKLDKASFEKLLREKGVNKGSRIVIYDDKMCCDAARLWWMLRINGCENISLLNGGLQQYKKEGGELVTDVTKRNPGDFKFSGRGLGLEAKRQLISSVLHKEDWVIIDARSIEEHMGQIFSKNCKKMGRIPGSLPLDWAYSVNYHEDQKFKSADALRKIFEIKGVEKEDNIIAYCRSGVRSAHTTFVLTELLGYPNVYNYDGSWLEWSSLDNLPVELKKI